MLTGKRYAPLDFAMMAWRRKWWLVVPAIVGGYAALVVSSRLVDQYQAEMLIQIVPQRVPESFVQSTVTMRTEDRINALSQQVMSRTELERLITQMDLYPAERARLPMQDVVDRMRSNAIVDVVKSQQDSRDAEAFYVRFTYPDRDIATRVTDRIGHLFIDVNARDRGALADATSSFLDTQLEEARHRLEEQERKLEQFRGRNSGRLPDQVNFNMQNIQNAQLQLQAIGNDLARLRDRKLDTEQRYADAEAEPIALPPAPIPSAPGVDAAGAVTGTPEQQLALMQDGLAKSLLRYKPDHPEISRIKRRIADLEKLVAAEKSSRGSGTAPVSVSVAEQTRRNNLQQMHADIESLDRQITFKEGEQGRLQNLVREYQARIEQTPGVESESVAIMRDYATLQEAYKGLRENSERSRVAAELEKRQIGEQFRVLDAARPPLRPTGVKRLQVNALGVAFGFGVGLLLAAFLEFKDTTIQRKNDVVEVFQLPVIAMVPAILGDAEKRQITRQRRLAVSVAALSIVAGGYGFWALQLWKHLT
jgi:polysaccharide chain length determinant protein (PEP-CTERM system associated)